MIKGGYILQPRIIQESELMKWGPCVREIWFWMLRKANHADNEAAERGCFHFMQKDIQDDLCWYVGYRRETYSKDQITKAVRKLCEGGMIETTKATRGMFCKVLKYSYYQDPKNYEGNYEGNTKATRRQHEVLADKQERKNVRTEESFEAKASYPEPEKSAPKKTKTSKPDEIPENLQTPEFLEVWEEWKQHRKEKRQTLTDTTKSKQLKSFSEVGPDVAIMAISDAIEKGYTGVFIKNFTGQQTTQATKKSQTPKGEPIKTEPLYNPFTDPNFGKGTVIPKNTIELKDGEYERL